MGGSTARKEGDPGRVGQVGREDLPAGCAGRKWGEVLGAAPRRVVLDI